MDKILNQLRDERFTIGHCKMVQLDRDCASRLFMQEMDDVNPTLPDLVESITIGPVVVLELFGQNAIRKLLDVVGENWGFSNIWRLIQRLNIFYFLLGPDCPNDAKELYPNSIRAKFGTTLLKNVAFCSKSVASVAMVSGMI